MRVIDLVRNCGKAVALREGVRRARGDLVAFFDADLQYTPRDLVKMVSRLNNGIDFVNGSRDYNGYGASRTAFSRLYNKVVRLLFRMQLRDSNCGIKVLKKEAAGAGTIFDYGLPLVVPLLKVRGFEATEFPVTLHERKNEFALDHGATPAENQAIEDALRGLGILRKEVAAWHESKRAG